LQKERFGLELFELKKEKRYLITTAEERTWKFDRPVLFLGEWCRIYERKHIWQHMDAVVAAPYGLGMAKKDADHADARALEGKLFPEFFELLNQHHNMRHSERFWRILLGHWFSRMVDVLLNRAKTLEVCLKEHEISGTTVYANDNYVLATPDSNSSIYACNDDRWNIALTERILNLIDMVDFSIEVVAEDNGTKDTRFFRFKDVSGKQSFKRKIFKLSRYLLAKAGRPLVSDDDAFIISSYLPRKEVIKLELALGQWPQFWDPSVFEVVKNPNSNMRKALTDLFASNSKSGLERILRAMLFELIPICYLEGFEDLQENVRQQKWPKNPKFIFTSNSFDTDETFKLWTAIKVQNAIKYYVGQHGNNYGTHRYISPSIEELTSDKFITWGWVDGLPQHTPAFCFKTAGRKHKYYDPKGGLLLIELCLHHRNLTWDGTSEFTDYFNQQIDFVKRLAIMPRENLTVRLHAGYRYMHWNEEARWTAFDSTLKIDTGAESIRKLIFDSRLIIHSYDSTGILETLSQNIPTLAFWQNGFDHLRESAKPYYQLLVDSGIVHFSAESVAEKVNRIWDDVDGWWRHSQVQDARRKFCDRYARVNKSPVRELRNIMFRPPLIGH
jgi:putative transferase (TIGR04331 family)